MNNPEYAPWSQIPPYAVWLFIIAALGWIVAPVLGFILGGRKERATRIRKAYDSFDLIVASQFSSLDGNRWSEARFYTQSVPILTEAIYSLRPFLPSNKWGAAQRILSEYQAHHESEFEGGITRAAAAINKEPGDGAEHHFGLLRQYLDRFSNITKKA